MALIEAAERDGHQEKARRIKRLTTQMTRTVKKRQQVDHGPLKGEELELERGAGGHEPMKALTTTKDFARFALAI
ncbi:MAG: hypothetical protein AAF762_00765 [Pseudomonadota bacterium]